MAENRRKPPMKGGHGPGGMGPVEKAKDLDRKSVV